MSYTRLENFFQRDDETALELQTKYVFHEPERYSIGEARFISLLHTCEAQSMSTWLVGEQKQGQSGDALSLDVTSVV